MKRMVIGMALAMALFFGWFALMSWINANYGEQLAREKEAQPASAPATQPAPVAPVAPGTQPITAAASVTTAPSTTAPSQMSAGIGVLEQGETAGPITLGSAAYKNDAYALAVEVVPRGAGISGIVLNDFLADVTDPGKQPYRFQEAQPDVLAQYGHPLGTRTITVNGTSIDVSNVSWNPVGSPGPGEVTYSVMLGTPGNPMLRVLKTYRVFTRDSQEHRGLGYEIRVDYAFENLSGRPLTVSMAYNGPVMPPRELDAGPDQRVMAGYPDVGTIAVENYYVESFSGEEGTRELSLNEDKVPVWWAGTSSVYFQGIMMPPLLESGQVKTPSVRSFQAIGLHPNSPDRQPVVISAETADLTIAPHQRLTYPINVFFGPKWRAVLNQPFYDMLPRDYDQTLVVRAGPCAFCTFDWLINVLVAMLAMFHTVVRDWGLAIICLVVLVRLALHPITKRSQISMLKMGKMAPEMERLKKKYADNKEELQKAMWEFQKQQGITPILGCLPMFLQMPIWIALWSALNTTFELRHSNFLWGLTWIDDLAKPDRLIPLPAGWGFRIPLIGVIVDAFNILPILLAVVFYLQMKFQPKPPTMSKEQEQQQKIMQVMMVFLFPLFLYGQPSGLNLYILTSTAIGIWESKRIRRHIKEKEEAEKAGVVLVDAEPPRDSGTGKRSKKDGPPGKGGKGAARAAAPQGWLARKLAELQAKAEQARQEAQRTQRRKG